MEEENVICLVCGYRVQARTAIEIANNNWFCPHCETEIMC